MKRVDARVIGMLLASLAWTGCGTSNLNRMVFVAEEDDEAADALYEKARILYDKGEYTEALKYAQKSVDLNRDNEAGGILVGYIHLGLAGFDIFRLASRLIEMNQTQTAAEGEETSCKMEGGADAGEALEAFNCLFEITEEELFALAEDSETDPVSGKLQISSNEFFDDLPVLYPKVLAPSGDEPDPRDSVGTLLHLKEAIGAICPFVNPPTVEGEESENDVRLPSDYRHECTPTVATRRADTKAHFLWAIAHLLEAVALNNVLLFRSDGTELTQSAGEVSDSSANLLKRVSALNQSEFVGAEILTYVEAVEELAVNVNKIFSFTEHSVLRTVLGDLQSTVRAFDQIPGIPSKMTKSINSAMEKIQSAADELGAASGDDSGSLDVKSKALRGKLNKSVAKNLGSSIEKFAQSDGVTTQQVAEVCEKFYDIAEGIPEEELQAMEPDSCTED